MAAGDEWLELRATRAGLHQLGEDRPGGEPAHGGVLSIVAQTDAGSRLRRLPTLFLGPSPLFADRDIDAVIRQTSQTIEHLQRSYSEPIFLATEMKVGGHRGLYARDYNARSAYRRRLERLGAEFSQVPFTALTPESNFQSQGGEAFRPSFVISESVDEPDTGVHPVSPGLLVSQVAMLRLGRMDASELGLLARALAGSEGIGAAQPAELFERLTA